MEFIGGLIDFVLHIDQHLVEIVNTYQAWTYLILFLIIFAETGFVVTPFLPGDSLLFATGAIIAKPETDLNIYFMAVLLVAAGFFGDMLNYHVGQYFGDRAFNGRYRFLKREYLDKTHKFYEKHGGKTIIYARFIPIVRTFAPFVAGVGSMSYARFGSYNIIGAIIWVFGFLFLGYFFGGISFVENNFSMVILAIIILSLLPPIIEVIREKRIRASKKS